MKMYRTYKLTDIYSTRYVLEKKFFSILFLTVYREIAVCDTLEDLYRIMNKISNGKSIDVHRYYDENMKEIK